MGEDRGGGLLLDGRGGALIDALNRADGLMRSPRALAGFLEACGKVALERAGAILAGRVGERMAEEEVEK